MFKNEKEYLDFMDSKIIEEEIKEEAKMKTVEFENPFREYDQLVPFKGLVKFAEDIAVRARMDGVEDEEYTLLWRCCVRYCNGFLKRVCHGFYTLEELQNEIFILMDYLITKKKKKWKDGYFLSNVLLLFRNKYSRKYSKAEPIRAYSDIFFIINHEEKNPVSPNNNMEEDDLIRKALSYVENNYEPLLYDIFKYRLIDNMSDMDIRLKLAIPPRDFFILLSHFRSKVLTDRKLYFDFIK
jgi:hypothetical protein